ncbi:ornithine decarboxylase antizyme-domain-containing protein [Xylariomycetidae sp. FL0641]|nr:ornithine decarboxylase antizyme-domain-containing protein [Xylariomycetidae sp. FL0641]
MAPMKTSNSSSNCNYGEAVARQVNVLASCYLVSPTASLKGLHYCTTGAAGLTIHLHQGPSGIPEVPISGLPSPPSSPPLAAFTSENELALQPKPKKRSSATTSISRSRASSRRGGATFQIREECERFFCETMAAVFQGERNTAGRGSFLTGVHCALTPPDDYSFPSSQSTDGSTPSVEVKAWMEFWDYAGGASFRAFISEDADGEKSLFAFFDSGLVSRDLKPALVALIELAEGPLECSHVVICMDRSMADDSTKSLMRSLQWVGFEMTTLDHWAKGLDVTSDRWLFMGMET